MLANISGIIYDDMQAAVEIVFAPVESQSLNQNLGFSD